MELNCTRPTALGLTPITYSDLHAFFTLIGERPERWQLAAIRRLDMAVLEAANKS